MPSLVEKVTWIIQDMETEVLEATGRHQALREMFGWKEDEDIFLAVLETKKDMAKMKKEL